MSESETPTSNQSSSSGALVFVSHDTRDAEIAEAFSKLLSSVSAGVLKSFRSSDKKGNQGIEYGVDWYPEIMGKLKNASDVVCLLTPHSINRPWILYEAGVAKGQLETPVHGLAIGIALPDASAGPFAQFQNSDDSVDSITSLVMQLVARIPNAEPDREVVVAQVETFRSTFTAILAKQGHEKEKPKKVDNSSVAKLFEEIKVMYQDLPGRIESKLNAEPRSRRRRFRFHPEMLHHAVGMGNPRESPFLVLVMLLGQYYDRVPWLYDMVKQIYFADVSGNIEQVRKLSFALQSAVETVHRNPLIEEMYGTKELFLLFREVGLAVDMLLSVAVERPGSLDTNMKEE